MEDRGVLFVFGMGRSGTSALTRVLSLSGASLPGNMMGPGPSNERGYWEPLDAVKLNDDFLRENRSSWFDPTLRLEEGDAVPVPCRRSFVGRIQRFFASCPRVPLLVVKDPRIAALSEYWMQAAAEAGLSAQYAIPVRHPGEVAASLADAEHCMPELSVSLWLKYNLLAERKSRRRHRVFIEYPKWINGWRSEMDRVFRVLGRERNDRAGAEIDAFLSNDLYRHKVTALPAGPLATMCEEVYGRLSLAAAGEPVDEASFDRCYDRFASIARSLRVATADVRSRRAQRSNGLPN